MQLPYDANPPLGIEAGVGISVDAQFSPDEWQTVYTQPAFHFQAFEAAVKSGREWFYPTGEYAWKVRFAPYQAGEWQYRLVAQDASGRSVTPAVSFTVVPSSKPGFIRVSQQDPRYFEYENGAYFPALGYNMNFDRISWQNPTLDNEENFRVMSASGIQLARIWLSQWGIYGSAWNPWNTIVPGLDGYIPYTGMSMEEAYSGSDVSMRISAGENDCMFIGHLKARPAVRRETNYRVRVRYKLAKLEGPRVPGKPYGFVAKTGGWLWGDGGNCPDSGTGTPVTLYQSKATGEWQVLEGSLYSGQEDFLPNFYLALENVDSGVIFIDSVWIEEDLGGGQYGPNIVSKPWMAHHLYMEQRNSFAFDRLLDLAERYDIYLRSVIMEKNEYILNHFDEMGRPIEDNRTCYDSDPANNPERCPGNDWFYGNWREMTKTRWLQQAWWRYLQARWGYSTQIHSWELLNEGDPFNSRHYALADEFGKYMRQFKPNDHLVSTSFWHSFPRDEFFTNPEYPHVDFADIHRYVEEGSTGFDDTALASYLISMEYGARQPGGAGKPVLRGETGFVTQGTAPETAAFQVDTQGIWLHNFIWAGINSGGLIESYWYDNSHIYKRARDGSLAFDFRFHFKPYFNFIQDISLNNGNYQDASAHVSNNRLRVWGQKDVVNGQAHLWIQNAGTTWRKANRLSFLAGTAGTVRLGGFKPGAVYQVEWWDTYQTNKSKQVIRREVIAASETGELFLTVERLVSDVAVKIYLASP